MSQLYTQKYPAIAIGNQGDDFLSTSSDKVADVLAEDSDYIYIPSDLIPERLYLIQQLGTSQVVSEIYNLPEEPAKIVIPFIRSIAPDGTAWSIQKWNDTFVVIVDSTHTYHQSFTFEQEEISDLVTQGGFELTANWGTDGLSEIRIKGLKLEKVRQWLA